MLCLPLLVPATGSAIVSTQFIPMRFKIGPSILARDK